VPTYSAEEHCMDNPVVAFCSTGMVTAPMPNQQHQCTEDKYTDIMKQAEQYNTILSATEKLIKKLSTGNS